MTGQEIPLHRASLCLSTLARRYAKKLRIFFSEKKNESFGLCLQNVGELCELQWCFFQRFGVNRVQGKSGVNPSIQSAACGVRSSS